MQNKQYKTILYQNYQDLNRLNDAWIFFYKKCGITLNNFNAIQLLTYFRSPTVFPPPESLP